MPAPPPYMRFYPDVYLRDTIGLTVEEQGVYMRLLCEMWQHGGKITNDDRIIAKSLLIHLNKWRKVKPQLMPYLSEHSPGYLTQKKLREEYKFSSGVMRVLKKETPQVTQGVTPPVSPQVTQGVTPLVTQTEAAPDEWENSNGFQPVAWLPEGGVARALARALDQSKSKSKQNKNYRYLEDGGGENCGQLEFEESTRRFVLEVIEAFEAHRLQPPPDYDVVKSWIDNGCDPFLHILKAVKTTLGRYQRGGEAVFPGAYRRIPKRRR